MYFIGYPDKQDELQILMDRDKQNPIDSLLPVIRKEELLAMQREVEQVYIHKTVYEYIIDLADATRHHEMIELGISPRGSLALSKMAKAAAYVKGREFVLPNDVEEIFPDVAVHRIRLNSKGKLNHLTGKDVIEDILKKVKKPVPQQA